MQQMIPYIIEGEITDVQKRQDGESNKIQYTCRAQLPDGSDIVLTNVTAATMFGGIGDYFRRRARATSDAKEYPEDFEASSLDATIGERVYISFINGNMLYPLIIAWAEHPNQTDEPDVDEGDEPNAVLQYLGIRAEINKDGEIKFIHKGAPKVKYEPVSSGLFGAVAGAAASLLGGSSAIKGNDNPALEPEADDEVTLWEMLKGGVFRVRDAEGQIIELDRTKKRIYISNNDLKSTQEEGGFGVIGNAFATNSTDAEYILLDKDKQLVLLNARKIAQIYSFDARKDVTGGNHSHKIGGNSEWLIGGDEVYSIAGNVDKKIAGDMKHQIAGNKEEKIIGDWKVEAVGDVILKDALGGTVSISKGKIVLKGFTGTDVLEILSQTLQLLSTTLGNLGYPISTAPAFVALKAQIDLIKG